MTQQQALTDTSEVILLPLIGQGKVRDMYALPSLQGKRLMVSSDRISAFDKIMTEPIPDKGEILTRISTFWFEKMDRWGIPHHMVTADITQYPSECEPFLTHLDGRSMIVEEMLPVPVECICRGYLSGSFYTAYQHAQIRRRPTESPLCNAMYKDVYGFQLPVGMQESEAFSESLFTPSTKADVGQHDENISFEDMCMRVDEWLQSQNLTYTGGGEALSHAIRELCMKVYKHAMRIALTWKVIIADTKFEVGLRIDEDRRVCEIVMIDEVLTPDSSRFWPVDQVVLGQTPPSYDKQGLRDWLKKNWTDRSLPPPALPADIVEMTRQQYLQMIRCIPSE